MDSVAQCRILRDLVADDHEFDVLEFALPAQQVERFNRSFEILVRLDVAGVEDERIVELITLPDPRDVVFRRRLAETLVDAVVDDVDLLRRHAEIIEDVAFRGLRDREDAIRAVRRHPHRTARVRIAQPVGKVLRKPQVDAVVDGDDCFARRQRRQHVVRCVKQLRALTAKIEGNRHLLAYRVAGRALRHCSKVLTEMRQ